MTRVAPRRILATLSAVVIGLVASATAAAAHPLGNFTVNSAARVIVSGGSIDVHYTLDLAEIPTVQVTGRIDTDGDGDVSTAETDAWGEQRCVAVSDGLSVTVDGARAGSFTTVGSTAEFVPGQAGLRTLRLDCVLRLSVEHASSTVEFEDANELDRIGWREVTVAGDGVTVVTSDVPATSPSSQLRAYPEGQLSSPLEVTTATFSVRPGGPALAAQEAGLPERGGPLGLLDRATTAYTDLISQRELTLGFGLFALVVALFLGALHALAPGHGKTVMAAYVVGERGTLRQAGIIGGTVATTHTLGVLTLGIVLSASETLAPERFYPWFGAVSGAFIVAIGIGLLRRALRSRRRGSSRSTNAHEHDHDHAHEHDHDHTHEHEEAHDHDHGAALEHTHGGSTHRHEVPTEPLTLRTLLALGFAGGLVPSPSALVVLLGAIALGRTWFGVILVIAYGLGLAATLVGGGLLLLRARTATEGWLDRADRTRSAAWATAIPVLTAALVIAGGTIVAIRAVA